MRVHSQTQGFKILAPDNYSSIQGLEEMGGGEFSTSASTMGAVRKGMQLTRIDCSSPVIKRTLLHCNVKKKPHPSMYYNAGNTLHAKNITDETKLLSL